MFSCMVIVLIVIFAVRQVMDVNTAHQTFENYYTFRGCTQLLKRTNDYGFCKLSSGKVIKLVRFQGKWYLDGDLPTCTFTFCF